MKFFIKKEDCWIGLFWKTEPKRDELFVFMETTYYLCLLPCLVLSWKTEKYHMGRLS